MLYVDDLRLRMERVTKGGIHYCLWFSRISSDIEGEVDAVMKARTFGLVQKKNCRKTRKGCRVYWYITDAKVARAEVAGVRTVSWLEFNRLEREPYRAKAESADPAKSPDTLNSCNGWG